MSPQVTRLLLQLKRRGALVYHWEGTTDVSLCRNLLLGQALREQERAELFFFVDDDMDATVEQVDALCQIPEGYAAQSGLYALKDGRLAAKRITDTQWATGLGFFAARAAAFRDSRVTEPLPKFEQSGHVYTAYCESAARGGSWRMDDESLCRALRPAGGVHLDPKIIVGHIKSISLYPSAEAIRTLVDGPRG